MSHIHSLEMICDVKQTGIMNANTFIGFGEAGQAFAHGEGWRAFDTNPAKTRAPSLTAALDGADVVISVVTADQALTVAREAASSIAPGALYCDMNSVAPATKQAAAAVIEAAGARYVDVAVMSPVLPARLTVPLLLGGPHAEHGAVALRGLGFTNVRIVPGDVGRASSIKMIRSVMIKGIEALTAEMLLAGDAAGVRADVLASLGDEWPAHADYNIERMATHGLRRAAEMEEVAKTLVALGIEPVMTRGTIARQRAIGSACRLQDIAA
jgi:3-hydroxyisobutyrate dehydrogenase-like beta-hydroxyacid dehydrogenase